MHIATYEPTGKLIGIDRADNGKNCQCHCVSCKGELVAKKGATNQWHFAHFHNSKKECDYSFWVVCRDLAKQIFSSKKTSLNATIRLSNEIGPIQISDIKLDDTKRDDITFDVSFLTKEYGRVFIYFLTPEQNRQHFDDTASFSENVLLIKLKGIEHKKEKVTEELQNIIVEGFNVKKFLDKTKKQLESTSPVNVYAPTVSLFDEIEEEERLVRKALEISRNTPDISQYNADEFMRLLLDPKFEVNTAKFSPKDISCVRSLNTVFLGFVAKYGYDCHKHFGFKEIANNTKVFFASFNNTFVGYVMLDVKFIRHLAKLK